MEIGNIASCLCHLKAKAQIGRDLLAVLCPVDKHVASIGRHRQRACAALRISAGTRNRSCAHRVGQRCNLVAGQLEVRNIGGGFSHRDCVVRAVGNNLAALRPVHECVALVRCGAQRDR